MVDGMTVVSEDEVVTHPERAAAATTRKRAIVATRIGFAIRFTVSNFGIIIRNLPGCVLGITAPANCN
jgi:hypothetical protein